MGAAPTPTGITPAAVKRMPTPPPGQQAALGSLLACAVDGVVQAQRRLDGDALARVTEYIATPQGGLALPPLWFTFSEVNLQLELTATLTRTAQRSASGGGVRLECRMLNPAAVSLFGYQASSGFKVSLNLAPREAASAAPPVVDEPGTLSDLPHPD